MAELSHIDESGRARMVDVTAKRETAREAVATGTVRMQPSTLALIQSGGVPKGDVIAVAQVAGVMAAKRTCDLIPMCHPLLLTDIDVREEKWVTHGDQLAGALGRHHARDLRHGDDVALGHAARLYERERFRLHADRAGRDRFSRRLALRRHVYHARAPRLVDMTQLRQISPSAADLDHSATPWPVAVAQVMGVRLARQRRHYTPPYAVFAPAAAQRRHQVDLVVGQQAGAQLPGRGEPHPVAAAAEALFRERADEADPPLRARQTVVARRAVAVAALGLQRAKRLFDPAAHRLIRNEGSGRRRLLTGVSGSLTRKCGFFPLGY